MADNNANEIAIAGRDVGESSDTTIEIKIKTLDSHIHTLRVNRDMPVPVLKEQIAALIGVPLERQRLICRGKVLKDDQLLSDYHVEDGHTLHLVVRQPLPPSSSSTAGTSGGDGTSEQQGTDPTAGIGRNRNGQVAHNVVFGTFNLQDQGEGGFPDLNRILATVLNSIGIGNLSPANLAIGGGPTMMMQGNASDGQNQADSTAEVSQTGSQQPPAQAVPNAQSAPRSLNTPSPPQLHLSSQQMVIPDALTTLSHYLNHMVQAFSHHGYESQPHSFTSSTGAEDQMAASGIPSFLRGLPRPAALGSLVRHTQLLLSGPARNAFSDLAGLLEGESAVTDTATRAQIQSTVMHDGVLMQELGALLLELGRATLTLRMGQSHDESVVNAGPAIYISSSRPNPIMVQPLPFQHGDSLGPFQTGFVNPTAGFTGGVSGAGEVPRNINIHIHSGPPVIPGGGLVTPANSDQGNQPNAPQNSGTPDQVGNVIAGSRETGAVRVVPVRTVVAAVPVRPPTEGNNATNNVFHPLLTTIQQLNSTQGVPIRGLAQATIGLQSNGIDGAQQQSIGTMNFNQAQANSILAQIQAQAQRFQGGTQNMGFQAQNVEGSIQTQNSLPVPAMSSAANTPVSVQHDTQNQSSDFASVVTDQQVMPHGLSPENSATDINGSAMDGGDIVRNDNIGNVAVSGSNEMAYIANAVLQQMMGTYGRSGRANQQQSDQQQSNASPLSRNESTSMPNEPKSHVTQFEDKQDSSQLENTITEMGSGVRSTDIDMQEYDLTSTSGKEIASTSCTNSQSKTVQPKSNSPKAVPVGLGLGGLQPPPSKKRAKPLRKLPENNDAAPPVNQDKELSTERGHNLQQDHFANSASNNHRTHENASSEQLSGGLAQMFGSMASGGRTGNGRVDIGNIMSQLLRTPAVNNILRGVAEQTGTVAPGELSNIIEQVTQSPVLRNTMQQMTERLGEHGEEIENAFSGMVGREGGIDFSRVMQQMMPIMSQVLGSASGGTSFGLGSDAQLRGSDAQLRASNSEASTEDDHAANQNSQSNLEPTVQKLENHDPPQEVFRSMVENAMTLYRENDGSHNGVNTSEVLHQLSNTEDLANEYLAMLNRDLITRLQSESGSAENS